MYVVGGLHLEGIPEAIKEVIEEFQEAILEIKIKSEDGHHWDLIVEYDEEIYEGIKAARLLKIVEGLFGGW